MVRILYAVVIQTELCEMHVHMFSTFCNMINCFLVGSNSACKSLHRTVKSVGFLIMAEGSDGGPPKSKPKTEPCGTAGDYMSR